MTNSARKFQEAVHYHTMGNLELAKQIYHELLQQSPTNTEAWYQLGMAWHQEGKLGSALECVDKAIRLKVSRPNYFELKGNILQDMGRLEEAGESYKRAMQLNPDAARVHNNLGIILNDQGETDEAISCFHRAIQLDRNYARAYNNLGAALQSRRELKEAAGNFRKAVKLKPDYFVAIHNLGAVSLAMGDRAEAESCFRRVLQLKPDYRPSYLSLGRLLLERHRAEEAEPLALTAVKLSPADASSYELLGEVQAVTGKTDQAIIAYRQAMQLDPASLKSALGVFLTLPQVYRDRPMLEAAREHFANGLHALIARIDAFKQNTQEKIISGILRNNFYLAYQGLNDKTLQQEYSRFMAELLATAAPEFFLPIQQRSVANRRIRIGFLSYCYYRCTVGQYFSSWATRLDRTMFEIFVYYTNSEQDELTRTVEGASDHFNHLHGSVLSIAQKVRDDQLDILVYPEVGMVSNVLLLSAMRLAPIQCAGWGHPVTTGHANMDYYFSSALMEPENAAEHYSEKLVLLDGIGTYYPKNMLPDPAKREGFQLPEGKHLYLCPQSLFKIHPDNDSLLVRILEKDRDGVLVFFTGRNKPVTDAFVTRLSQVFVARGLDTAGRVKMLPTLDHEDFLRVNMLCDVMLDTLHWSGGNTSLDALSCALPMVTLPGKLMRGRQSCGMLKAMGITELVAENEDDYVRIALELGRNPTYRREIADRIRATHDKIFENETPIRQLERNLRSFISAPTPEIS